MSQMDAPQWSKSDPISSFELASFKRRAGALIVDSIILTISTAVMLAILRELGFAWDVGFGIATINVLGELDLPGELEGLVWYSVDLLSVLLGVGGFLAYKIGFESRGKTPGKDLFDLWVVDAEAMPPGVKRAAKRAILPLLVYLARWSIEIAGDIPDEAEMVGWFKALLAISVVMVLFGILNYLWMLWDDYNQTLHDKVGGTYVVHAESLKVKSVALPPMPSTPYWENVAPSAYAGENPSGSPMMVFDSDEKHGQEIGKP